MSPVNGTVLVILFPPYFITNITKCLYDYDNGIYIIYILYIKNM